MTHRQTLESALPASATHGRLSSLLARYPALHSAEKEEISNFFRTGRYREIGLLLADRKMQPSLDRFMADRATHFPPRLHPGAAIALAIGVTIAMMGVVEALML